MTGLLGNIDGYILGIYISFNVVLYKMQAEVEMLKS
jgi:hypothetical protein